MWSKLKSWVEKNEGLILIMLLVVVLRIPSLYEPYWYGDEGIYLVLGQGLKKGLVFYRDIHDNKPPLLYILAAIAGNVFYFRLMLMGMFAVATGVFFRLVQRLMPKEKKAWYLSTLLMIILTTAFEGNIANAEIFIVLPVTAAMLLLWNEEAKQKRQWKNYLWAGLLFSAGFMLKVPALFDMMAAGFWLVFLTKDKWREVFKRLADKNIWMMVLGFLLPIVLSLAYYYNVGAGERYFRSALGQNIGYLSSWQTGEHTTSGFSSQSGLMVRAELLAVSLLALTLVVKRFKLSKGFGLMSVWFLFGLFGALLSERPYPHYLIQPAVPLAILISYLLFGRRKLIKMGVLMLGVIGGLAYYQIRFWHYPLLPYYQNFAEYVSGKKSQEEYRNYFDPRVNQSYQIGEYIKNKTGEDDKIFVWGDEPFVYALSERLPIGRYTVAYHVVDFNGYEEVMAKWDENRPRIVVVMSYETRPFPEMYARLATDYVRVADIGQAQIYRQVNGVTK